MMKARYGAHADFSISFISWFFYDFKSILIVDEVSSMCRQIEFSISVLKANRQWKREISMKTEVIMKHRNAKVTRIKSFHSSLIFVSQKQLYFVCILQMLIHLEENSIEDRNIF